MEKTDSQRLKNKPCLGNPIVYITIFEGCGGWNSGIFRWVEEEGFGFYEPQITGFNNTVGTGLREDAVKEAISWSQSEELPYWIPPEGMKPTTEQAPILDEKDCIDFFKMSEEKMNEEIARRRGWSEITPTLLKNTMLVGKNPMTMKVEPIPRYASSSDAMYELEFEMLGEWGDDFGLPYNMYLSSLIPKGSWIWNASPKLKAQAFLMATEHPCQLPSVENPSEKD